MLHTLTAYAQQAPHWGLGVAILGNQVDMSDALAALSEVVAPIGFYVPINFQQVRLEPEVGMMRIKVVESELEQKFTALRIGGGIFATRFLAEALQTYLGGRIGLMIVSL